MPRSLLSRRRRGGRSMLRSHLIDAGEAPLFFRFASRASIRSLREVDRPPRRSLSNEPLIARGTPPNLGGEFLLQAPHKWPISLLIWRAEEGSFLVLSAPTNQGSSSSIVFTPKEDSVKTIAAVICVCLCLLVGANAFGQEKP